MFKRKKEDKEPQNMEELLRRFGELKEENESLKQEIEQIKEREKYFLQFVSVVRFNPFKGSGGNQSFTVALLDGNSSGVVITSIYSKEGNRIYGKPINQGASDYSLSQEEKQAIESAENKE